MRHYSYGMPALTRQVYKIHGSGPRVLAATDAARFFKFVPGRRSFVKIETHEFSVATDAVCLPPKARGPGHLR